MATAVDTPTVIAKPVSAHSVDAIPFAANLRSDDLSGCETIKAAPASGRLVLEHILISSDSAITVTIGEGETGSAVTTAIMGPIAFAAGQFIEWEFSSLVALSATTALTCDASGAGVVNIFVEGYTI